MKIPVVKLQSQKPKRQNSALSKHRPQTFKSPLKWIAAAGAIGAMGLAIVFDDKSLKYESGPDEDYLNPLEAWNHPITQKAWSDELVKVARDLASDGGRNETNYLEFICFALGLDVDTDDCVFTKQSCNLRLEAILNKYGSSLSE